MPISLPLNIVMLVFSLVISLIEISDEICRVFTAIVFYNHRFDKQKHCFGQSVKQF